MKKITENALLFRVNQLKEKMAMFEWATAADDRAQKNTASPNAGVQGIPGGVVDQTIATTPATTTPAKPTTNAPPLSQLANPTNKGSGPRVDPTAAPVAPGTAPKPGASAPAGKWPTTHDEIVAFQNANKLNPDGLIGEKTMAALKAQGIQAPAGFKPVANRQHPAAAQHPTQQQGGTAAKPASPAQQTGAPVAGQVMPNGTVSSGDADRDERLNQANQVMNMTADQRHQFDMAAGKQDYNAAHPTQTAQAQTAATQTPPPATTPANATDPNSALGKQISNAIPSSAPSSASTAQGPLGVKFQSQQQQPSSEWDQNDPDTPAMFRNPLPGEPGMHESVSYREADSLARIVQLSKW